MRGLTIWDLLAPILFMNDPEAHYQWLLDLYDPQAEPEEANDVRDVADEFIKTASRLTEEFYGEETNG